jgi:hypothetical protein
MEHAVTRATALATINPRLLALVEISFESNIGSCSAGNSVGADALPDF